MSQTNDPIMVGLIGCGRIAQTHIDAVASVSQCRLIGVADINHDVAKGFAKQHGCKAHNDYHQLFDAGSLDAVIICTPPNTHIDVASFFLDKGIHVLCEKPLAVTSQDAETLVAKAVENQRILMMASKFRYVDDVVKAKGIVDSGILGDVILYENVFCSRVNMHDRWNSEKAVGGGGVLIDNGTHSVDIARYLLGPIAMVRAEVGLRVQGLDVEDTCRLDLRTANGAMGTVDLSWSIHKERDAYIEVFGSQGVLSIGWKGSKYRQNEKSDWVEFGNGYDKLLAFASQLQNFAGAIRGAEAPLITAQDSLESVRVIEAAYRSMEMDKWVPVTGPSP